MRYFARHKDNKLLEIGTFYRGIENLEKGFYIEEKDNQVFKEITESEYNQLYAKIQEKANWYNIIYADESRIDEVPEEWRNDILYEVNEQKAAEQAAKENVSDAEVTGAVEAIL